MGVSTSLLSRMSLVLPSSGAAGLGAPEFPGLVGEVSQSVLVCRWRWSQAGRAGSSRVLALARESSICRSVAVASSPALVMRRVLSARAWAVRRASSKWWRRSLTCCLVLAGDFAQPVRSLSGAGLVKSVRSPPCRRVPSSSLTASVG